MRPHTRLLACLALTVAGAARAQPPVRPPADSLPLGDLSAFRAPTTGWRVAGGIAPDARQARALTATDGAGVLVGGGAPLSTTWEHGDLDLALEFMLPDGRDGSVLFQGRYELRLRDGAVGAPGAAFAGTHPRLDATRAPGLWQTLRVAFRAPRFDAAGRKVADARFARVELNGAVIHEDVRAAAPTPGAARTDERASGPLVLAGGRGPVAFRHVRVERYGGERARLSGLRYRAWHGDVASLDAALARTPVREGPADGVTSALAGAPDKFAVAFDGTIHVPVAGTYLFDLGFDWVDDDPQFGGTVVGGGRLLIDGREVLRHEGRLPNAVGRVALTAGAHAFSLAYYKMRPWTSRLHATLFVEGPGVERHALHAPRAPDLPGAIAVDPAADGGAVVQRGFVRVGDGKRTHAAAVGDAAGAHFTVDLARGALLHAWRGPFADATEMWHDRGNDQLLRPMGSVLTLSGAPALAVLPSDAAAWPDDADSAYAFRGYVLDTLGRPTFLARLGAVDVEDRVTPADGGLRRELRLRAPDAPARLFVRLASAASVRRLADGAYLVGDAEYYVVPDAGAEVVLRSAAGGQELLVPVRFRAGEARVAYTIVW